VSSIPLATVDASVRLPIRYMFHIVYVNIVMIIAFVCVHLNEKNNIIKLQYLININEY